MTVYPKSHPRKLSEPHRAQLLGSAISEEVWRERGTFTAGRGKDVPQDCGKLPAKPGLVFPVHTLEGGLLWRLRPDNPGRGPKYLQPKGQPNRLDVHPRQHERIKQPGGMRYVTEGEKKTDAGVTHDKLMVGMSGVWNGQKDEALIPDWDLLPMEGEDYSICFDSDIETNENVQLAAVRMARLLRERGANVFLTLIPPGPDGEKQGLDDFFSNGGTAKQLELLTRPFDLVTVEKARLTRDDELRALVADLWRTWWATEWKGQGGHTDRDVTLKLIEAASRHGKRHEDGVRVTKSWGALVVEAKVSSRTLGKSLNRVEEAGLLYRDNEGRQADKTGAFVMRAGVKQVEEADAEARRAASENGGLAPGALHLRAPHDVPRLRWSRPPFRPKRGTVAGTRKVRDGARPAGRDRLERLGKTRGAVVDALEASGGKLTLGELCRILNRKRPRDVRRRLLPMLEEAKIVEVEADVIALARDWRERLEAARERGGELEADELAETRRRQKSEAYRKRDEAPADPTPELRGPEAVAAILAENERAALSADAEKLEKKRETKRFVRDRVRDLGRIRLGLLEDMLEEDLEVPREWARPAAKSLGCTFERLHEYRDEAFVYAPADWSRGAA